MREPAQDERDAQEKHEPAERSLFPGGRVARERHPLAGASQQRVVFVERTIFHAQGFHDGQVRVRYCDAQKHTCGATKQKTKP